MRTFVNRISIFAGCVFSEFRFTLVSATLLTSFAFWSNSHSSRLSDVWRTAIGFSPLSTVELQWHRPLTSLLFTAGDRIFLQSLIMLCICVGLCEQRFRTATTTLVFFASHLIVTVGLALFVILPFHTAGAEWATVLASEKDVGPSAGYYGCLGFWIASLNSRHRRILILCLILVLAVRLVFSLEKIELNPATVSADLGHLAAFPLGLIVGFWNQRRTTASRVA